MATYLGDFDAAKTVRYVFDTATPTGAPVTMTAATVRVYKDNSTTESSAGITVTADFDSRTGLHLVEVDTSADATFYAAASDFFIVLVSATVNAITILSTLAHFSIKNRSVADVNVKTINAISTSAVTTVKAVQGLTTADVVASVTGAVGSVTAGVTVTTNNDKTGYALTSGERTSVADALLDRDMATGTDSGSPTVRTVRQALRFLRNKWSIGGGTLTVTKEDDTTSAWTAAVTTTAGNPVTTVDPA